MILVEPSTQHEHLHIVGLGSGSLVEKGQCLLMLLLLDEQARFLQQCWNEVGVNHQSLVKGVDGCGEVVALTLTALYQAAQHIALGESGVAGDGLVGIDVGLVIVAKLVEAFSLIIIDRGVFHQIVVGNSLEVAQCLTVVVIFQGNSRAHAIEDAHARVVVGGATQRGYHVVVVAVGQFKDATYRLPVIVGRTHGNKIGVAGITILAELLLNMSAVQIDLWLGRKQGHCLINPFHGLLGIAFIGFYASQAIHSIKVAWHTLENALELRLGSSKVAFGISELAFHVNPSKASGVDGRGLVNIGKSSVIVSVYLIKLSSQHVSVKEKLCFLGWSKLNGA